MATSFDRSERSRVSVEHGERVGALVEKERVERDSSASQPRLEWRITGGGLRMSWTATTGAGPIRWSSAGKTMMSERLTYMPRPAKEDLFEQALREDSNRSLDWLWLATQIEDPDERLYCLQRARALDERGPGRRAWPMRRPLRELVHLLRQVDAGT